jgi:LysR family hydrogen peroxide-inducible transcriptional activator
MEVHQLRYFVAVAQLGSFSRAAERCFVSQPSLSQQIQKLERGLGQRLFERLGRQVRLTGAGQMLLERATAILAALDDAERRIRETGEQTGGRLVVGVIPTIAPYLLPPVLKRFLREFPLVEVTVDEEVTARLIEAVATAELDLAVLALPVPDDRLKVEPLFTEQLYLTVDRRHRLAKQRSITLDDIREERFVVLREMHCLGEQVLSFCRAHGCQPQVACRSAQIATIQSMIAAGQGISILPEMARAADRDRSRVYRQLQGDGLTRTIAVISHRHRVHSAAAEKFLTVLREITAEPLRGRA